MFEWLAMLRLLLAVITAIVAAGGEDEDNEERCGAASCLLACFLACARCFSSLDCAVRCGAVAVVRLRRKGCHSLGTHSLLLLSGEEIRDKCGQDLCEA